VWPPALVAPCCGATAEAFTQTLLMTAEDFREFHAGFTGKRKPEYRGR